MIGWLTVSQFMSIGVILTLQIYGFVVSLQFSDTKKVNS